MDAMNPFPWGWLWLVPLGYAGLCLGYFLFHRFAIFHPTRGITRTPAEVGLEFSEVFFPSADRARLHGWWIPGAPDKFKLHGLRPALLFFPGNAGTLSRFAAQLPPWHAAGFDVLILGYRGFGKSAWRWPTESGLRRDARGAWRHLTQTLGLRPRQIVFYAQSAGCAIASWAAAEFGPAALILEGGFPSVAELTAPRIPWLPIRLLTTARFDTLRHLGRVRCPVLIAHSRDDRAVPFSYAKRLYQAAREPKTLFPLRGEHAQTLETNPKPFLQAIREFLSSAHAAP